MRKRESATLTLKASSFSLSRRSFRLKSGPVPWEKHFGIGCKVNYLEVGSTGEPESPPQVAERSVLLTRLHAPAQDERGPLRVVKFYKRPMRAVNLDSLLGITLV